MPIASPNEYHKYQRKKQILLTAIDNLGYTTLPKLVSKFAKYNAILATSSDQTLLDDAEMRAARLQQNINTIVLRIDDLNMRWITLLCQALSSQQKNVDQKDCVIMDNAMREYQRIQKLQQIGTPMRRTPRKPRFFPTTPSRHHVRIAKARDAKDSAEPSPSKRARTYPSP